MRAVLQRVTSASVEVAGKTIGKIDRGWLILLGIAQDDTKSDLEYMVQKTLALRAFPDEDDKLNLSIADIQGEMLAISQFTLQGDCRKGRRPSFSAAASPDAAVTFYNRYVDGLRSSGLKVETGQFQAMMKVRLENDGPVTFLLDSKKTF